jgi:hypothetical protein
MGKTLWPVPKYKKYAKMVSMTSIEAGKKSIEKLEKEFKKAKQRQKQLRILKVLNLSASQAGKGHAHRKNLHSETRKRFIQLGYMFKESYEKLHPYLKEKKRK